MTLNTIARCNKAGIDFSETVFTVETVRTSDAKRAKCDPNTEIEFEGRAIELFKYRSLRINLLVTLCVKFIDVLNIFMLQFFMKYL